MRRAATLGLSAMTLLLAACRQQMADQPKYMPLGRSTFFDDGQASRSLVPGTVARSEVELDPLLMTGKLGDESSAVFPFAVTRDVLARGQERYNIFCSPCHDRAGTGRGMIQRRGFSQPPSFHLARLRASPVGHYFDVITHGFGAMPSYAAQIPPRDRWAIIAYIRALQLSQHAQVSDVPAAAQPRLQQHD